ncbi:MAG: cytochrome c [Desulfovibrio sp.]
MRTIKAFVVSILVIIILAAGFALSGLYNVAATDPHWPVTKFLLELARERSVAVHSSGIQVPDLTDPKLLPMGVRHFHEMCRLCHGAPGLPRTEFAEGLYPEPPNLASSDIQELNDAELFWIVTNGLKLTGMPAFSPTHTREQIAGIVDMVRRLPRLKAADYEALVSSAGMTEGRKGGLPEHGSEQPKAAPTGSAAPEASGNSQGATP